MITLELTENEGWGVAASLAVMMTSALKDGVFTKEQRLKMLPHAANLVTGFIANGAMERVTPDGLMSAIIKLAPQLTGENQDVPH